MPSLCTSFLKRKLHPANHPKVHNYIYPFSSLKTRFNGRASKDEPYVLLATYGSNRTTLATSVLFGPRSTRLDEFKYLERWQTNDDPLCWSCSVPGREKRTLRSYMASRGRQAFLQVLKRRGWAEDGRRLKHQTNGKRTVGDLKGTLQLTVQPAMLTTKFEVVKVQAERILNKVIGLQANPSWKGDNYMDRKDKETKGFHKAKRYPKESVMERPKGYTF